MYGALRGLFLGFQMGIRAQARSAAISGSPARPCATSACSRRQRRSVCTVNLCGTSVSASQPATTSSLGWSSTPSVSASTATSWARLSLARRSGPWPVARRRAAASRPRWPSSAAYSRPQRCVPAAAAAPRRLRCPARLRRPPARRSRGPSARRPWSSPRPPTSTGCAARAGSLRDERGPTRNAGSTSRACRSRSHGWTIFSGHARIITFDDTGIGTVLERWVHAG